MLISKLLYTIFLLLLSLQKNPAIIAYTICKLNNFNYFLSIPLHRLYLHDLLYKKAYFFSFTSVQTIQKSILCNFLYKMAKLLKF